MHRQRTHEGGWLTESLPWLPPSRLFAHDRIRHCFECWWKLGDQKFPSQEAFITHSFLCLLWCWDFQHSSSSFRCTLMTEAPHLLSLCLSLDVFGRILAIFLIGLTLLSLTYIMEFAVLSHPTNCLLPGWLNPTISFRFLLLWVLRVWAPETGVCLDFWVIWETMIYTDWAGQAWVRGWEWLKRLSVTHEEEGGLIYLEVIATKLRNEKWYGGMEGKYFKLFSIWYFTETFKEHMFLSLWGRPCSPSVQGSQWLFIFPFLEQASECGHT